MQRIIRRRNEYATWSPVPRQFSHYSVSYAGRLTGITGVEERQRSADHAVYDRPVHDRIAPARAGGTATETPAST